MVCDKEQAAGMQAGGAGCHHDGAWMGRVALGGGQLQRGKGEGNLYTKLFHLRCQWGDVNFWGCRCSYLQWSCRQVGPSPPRTCHWLRLAPSGHCWGAFVKRAHAGIYCPGCTLQNHRGVAACGGEVVTVLQQKSTVVADAVVLKLPSSWWAQYEARRRDGHPKEKGASAVSL